MRQLEVGGECDVADWSLAQCAYGDIWNEIQLNNLIDHYNAYVNLVSDDIPCVKKYASFIKIRASTAHRVIAAYLFDYINKNYDLKTSLATNLPKITYNKAKPINTCTTCKEQFYNIYSMRKHKCINLHVRKQISLVPNKKRKIKFI